MMFRYKLLFLLLVLLLGGCSANSEKMSDTHLLVLNSDTATLDGEKIKEYSYTWQVNPHENHNEVKAAPAEYYSGEKAPESEKIYIDHELCYLPVLAKEDFRLEEYDGEKEWVYYYDDGVNNDYIFATLLSLNGTVFPEKMMHNESEAKENKVLHIKEAGTYILEGEWQGQLSVDLKSSDESAVVTLILKNVEINCSVAPALLFENLYESNNLESAGVRIVIADDSKNILQGENVGRMLKREYKDEKTKVQKKLRKQDGAITSTVSLSISGQEKGNGVLKITSGYEGISTDMHLSIDGGNLEINSFDDGLNASKDHVSVIALQGGNITIAVDEDFEGDGIDSNGKVLIDGASVHILNVTAPDKYVDSKDGIALKAGQLFTDGKEYQPSDKDPKNISSEHPKGYLPLYDISDIRAKIAQLPEDASYEDVAKILGSNGSIAGSTGYFDLETFKKRVEELDDSSTVKDILKILSES